MNRKLWTELRTWAGQDSRSVNGQIEFLLSEAVNRRKMWSPYYKPPEDEDD